MKKLIYSLLVFFVSQNVKSQEDPAIWQCGTTTDLINLNISNDANLITRYNQYESALIYKTTSAPSSTPYIIPVVFHVIQDASFTTPLPTYQQIQWQLATLNAAFSNSLASLNGGANGPRATNTQIKFCLAKYMQTSGGPVVWPNANTGVMNYTTTNTALTSNIVMTNTTSIATLASLTNYSVNFPPSMYLNIWCVPNITFLSSGYSINMPPSVMGVGTFPWMSLPVDGIIMRNDIIGNNNYGLFTSNMYAPFDRGTILAHEVGHYLGLFHTFETITSSNITTSGGTPGCYGLTTGAAITDGDLIYDTPPSLINGPLTGTINSCSEGYAPFGLAADENDLLEDMMTYSDDNNLNTFTLKQGQRMYGALDALWSSTGLTAQRFNLTTNANLSATGVIMFPSCGPGLLTSAFNTSVITSAITCSNAAVQFIAPVLPGYITGVTYNWLFGDGGSSTLSNPIHTYNNSPSTYVATLTVSDGANTSTTIQTITIPTGTPKIVGQSGNGFPVCKGTEQTILIQFPSLSNSATITDGTNIYTVSNNFVHNCTSPSGVYTYPFTFTATSNVSFSLIPASCGTVSNGVANFTVVDCCNNLVTNGNMESGNTGFYSNYLLNTTNTGNGQAAINFQSLVVGPMTNGIINTTGKAFFVDSYQSAYSGTYCVSGVASQSILLGQGLTGLKPSTNYYISFKVTQSYDSTQCLGYSNKFNLKLKNATSAILNNDIATSTIPPVVCSITGPSGGIQKSVWQVRNFMITTPATITPVTSFSIELTEIDRFSGLGHDFGIDNITLREISPLISITPTVSTICPGQTVQLLATGNSCTNLSGYTLAWTPNTNLSCGSCTNPVASPSVTTNYVLVAIPPVTNPPSPILTFSTTVLVANPINTIAATSTSICGSAIPVVTLSAVGFAGSTYTWQPGGANTSSIVVSPSITTTYTVSANSSLCSNTQTIQVAVLPPITFTNAPTSICTYQNLTYLENYLSATTPTGGSFYTDAALGVVYSVGTSSTILYVNPALTTIGTHTIYYTYTSPTNSLCTISNQFTINVLQGFGLSTNGITTFCSNLPAYTATITANTGTVTGTTFTWQPGTLIGATQYVTPSGNTIYTVTASNSSGCTFSTTAIVNSNSACCAASNYFITNTLTTGTYSNSWAINQNIVITGSVGLTGEFLLAPNVSITIPSGSILDISGGHLYSCGNMWSGIVVNNGGRVRISKESLIEDAITAVYSDGSSNTTTVQTLFDIDIDHTTFNKNYTAIKITNYNQSATNAPFKIIRTIFTSRTLTFTTGPSATWPATGLTSTDLRYAATSTTGLTPPYNLLGSALSNLKAPNSAIPSFYGIYLENVGLTSGGNFYQMKVGDDAADTYFNLFDAQVHGIYALNSNLQSLNNVFQNTQRVIICNPKCKYQGGVAIKHVVNTTMNAKLDLVATSSFSTSNTVANRFWNCHSGIEAYSVYRINVERAVFRSTQTTAGGTSILPGNIGFYANTNRFQYNLRFNEFSNVNTAVNIPLGTGAYDVGGGVQNGIYAAQMVINNNYFGPQTSATISPGTNYLNNAIFVSSPLSGVTWQLAANTGLYIQNNTIDKAYRGISVNGMNSYTTVINNNNVKLVDDNMLLQTQKGIEVVNTLNKVTVTTNTLSAANITNTLVALAYFGNNVGTNSPSVTCNKLSSSYKAFEFNNANNGTFWRGNTMQTHARGLTLANNATISVQGSSGSPQDNLWNGTWTAGINSGTYIDFSDAHASPLWYKAGSLPPTANGNVGAGFQYGASNTLSLTTGAFSCGGGGGGGNGNALIAGPSNTSTSGGAMSSAMTAGTGSPSAQDLYVGETTLYRYFNAYPSVKNTNTVYVNFYNAKQNTSTDKFTQIENNLFNGQTSLAQSNNNAVMATNAVEANYKNFYGLYIKHKNGNFSSADSTALVNICDLCAGLNGAVVYQARALYSSIYKSIKLYKENCSTATASNVRLQNFGSNETGTEKTLANTWSVDVFPNPNNGNFTLVSKAESETLDVIVSDVAGKIIFNAKVNTSNFISNLAISTKAGVYFITIKNSNNESTTKKLLINN
ncbi:MAG: T9SS type A sorting domain-containing protein, partial [Bacteroidota bacterium]|nr:T9SS type A sorting domain-containing protein [Bacteroidota bacterium]